MTEIAAYGITPATALVVLAAAALGTLVVFLWSLRRFEIALALVLLSSWVPWLFFANVEIDVRQEEAGMGTYLRIAMVALAGVIGYAKSIQQRSAMQRPVPPRFLLLGAFLVYGVASAAYSITAQYTLVRAAEGLLFLGFLLGFCAWLDDEPRLDRTLDILCAWMAVGLVLHLAALPLFPGRVWYVESPNRFQGLWGQPNTMGMFCLVCYPLFLWRYARSSPRVKPVYLGLLACALLAHVLSGSRSSLLAAAVGLVAWCIVLRQWSWLSVLAGVALIGMSALWALPRVVPSFQRNDSTDITDLTGRDEFWRNAYDLIKKKPVIGYGYEVAGEIWGDQQFERTSLTGLHSARMSLHNGYLNVAVGSGLIGLLLWLIILLLGPGRLLLAPPSAYKALLLVSMTQLLVLNFFESAITSSRDMGSLAFWLFWAISSKEALFSAKPASMDVAEESRLANRPAMLIGG